jgi:vacuolar-type H+-ATPase subunit C/Vma6
MYTRFVEFAEHLDIKRPDFLTKENYSLIFQTEFPELKKAIDSYRFQNEIKNCIKRKINGHLIKEMFPDLEGQQIGKILSSIRENYSDADLLRMSEADAKDIIESACIHTIEM